MSEALSDSLSIDLSFFEGDSFNGPLDLLLYLIKRNEVDIYDIPVGLITEQYLAYLARLEDLSLDAAGDFLVMASTLAQIKSKLLLPTLDEETGEEEEDPRMALVLPLLEYSRVQALASALGDSFMLDRDVFARGCCDDFQKQETESLNEGEERPGSEDSSAKDLHEEPPMRISLYLLVDAWRNLASRIPKEDYSMSFKMETGTIGDKLKEIRQFLIERKSVHFKDLHREGEGNLAKSLSFLATLELARTGFLRLFQDNEEDAMGPRLFLANPDAETSLEFDYR
jgi:segregation and condensation protein A